MVAAANSWALGPAQEGPGRPAGCPGARGEGLDAAVPDWTVGVVVGAVVEVCFSPPPWAPEAAAPPPLAREPAELR